MLNKHKKGVKTSLIALGKEFDIKHNYDKLHDALVDLELNLKVWNKIKWMLDL
jgi:transposase